VIDVPALIGSHDVLFVVLDSLRFDVAARAMEDGRTPCLAALFPDGWEERHSPATFTLPAHTAFFSGFLPTPGPRLFRARLPGRAAEAGCLDFDTETWVEELASRGYRTICVGGVTFFNPGTALGRILSRRFQDAYWRPDFGPASRVSTVRQAELVESLVREAPPTEPFLLFVNVSATHEPTWIFANGTRRDSANTQAAALEQADAPVGRIVQALVDRGRPLLAIVASDHGDAFGEDGVRGHLIPHETVFTVPFAAAVVEGRPAG
jgi:hypothetical protein